MTAPRLLVLACLFVAPAAYSQEDPIQPGHANWRDAVMQNIGPKFFQLLDMTKQLPNWDEQAPLIQDAVTHVFERNGWTSEADQFALSTMKEVEAFPPWDLEGRLGTLITRMSDRWNLSDEQRETMEYMMMREGMDFFAQHSDVLVEIASEAIQTRASGEPFTPEQVARFTEKALPLFEEGKKRFDEQSKVWLETLTPEQRALAQKDVDAAGKRATRVQQLGQDWAKGQWEAKQWGMENDPVQTAHDGGAGDGGNRGGVAKGTAGEKSGKGALDGGNAGQPNPNANPEAPIEPVAPGEQPVVAQGQPGVQPPNARNAAGKTSVQPTDPWAIYTRDFIARHGLNADQEQRAWLIYGDALDKATITVNSGGKTGDPNASQALAAALNDRKNESKVRQLTTQFERLKSRLDRIPTRAQKQKAAAATPPASEKAGAQKTAEKPETPAAEKPQPAKP